MPDGVNTVVRSVLVVDGIVCTFVARGIIMDAVGGEIKQLAESSSI